MPNAIVPSGSRRRSRDHPAVASFDVFETVLVRRLGEPSSLFLLLGRRLAARGLISATPEIFARQRIQAGLRAKRRSGRCDPTLTTIYDELGEQRGWSGALSSQLVEAELALESDLLVAWPPGAAAVATARRNGSRVVFVSDTYLPGTFVTEQLRRNGVYEPGDVVVVSCEAGGTKAERTLFPALRELLGEPSGTFTHVGNSAVADVAAVREAGFEAELLASGNLNRYERLMEDHRWSTGGLSSAFAGASRLSRVTGGDGDRTSVLAAVTAGVAGPMLAAFVLWLLRRAEQRGLQRLYFLSREGQILHRLTQILATATGSEIETRYLYVSRQSLNLAAVEQATPEEIAWTLTHSDVNTVRNLLRRVGLSPEDLAPQLRSLGIEAAGWDEVPDETVWRRLLKLLSEPPLARAVLERAGEQRVGVEAYLRAEGLYDEAQVGLVDVSGVGSQFRAIAALRSSRGLAQPLGFLFVRGNDPAMGDLLDGQNHAPEIEAFFNDAVRGVGEGPLPGLHVLLEVFCAADHGTVLGYDATSDGSCRPVLGPDPELALQWGLPTVHATLDRFARSLVVDDELLALDVDARSLIRALVGELWESPTRSEALVWGTFPFEGGSGVGHRAPLAPPASLTDLVVRRARGTEEPNWYHWRAAAIRRGGMAVNAAVEAVRLARRLRAALGGSLGRRNLGR